MFNLDNIKNRQASILGLDSLARSAVLVPLVYRNNTPHLLFEVRSFELEQQPGEICFPGGKIEDFDKNPQEGALRETCEELGIEKEKIELIGPLDILLSPFNAVIYPFVAILHTNTFQPDAKEVKEIFTVPLAFFLNTKPLSYQVETRVAYMDNNFPFHLVPEGKDYPWRRGKYPVLFYQYEDKIIWGITARIVNNFIQISTHLNY